jgi:hypothetical protein
MFRFHVSGSGDNSLAGGQTTLPGDNLLTFFQYGGAAGVVDSAIDTAAAHETGVGGIDDGIGSLEGNIALKKGEFSLINSVSKILHHVIPLLTIAYPFYGFWPAPE